jgi:AcrR family transcriptional regulator
VTATADTPRPVGRPRDPQVDAAVHEATAAMLAEVGYQGITIEAIAQTAGVSKNAIYRRWPDKVALVLGTLANLTQVSSHSVDTGDIRADMTTMLRAMSDALGSVDGRLATSLASDISRHPELAEAFHTQLVEPRRTLLAARLRRAVEAGQLPEGSDIDLLTSVGPALLYNRLLFEGVPPDHDYVDRIVEQFWG